MKVFGFSFTMILVIFAAFLIGKKWPLIMAKVSG